MEQILNDSITMNPKKFKTNAKCNGCVARIGEQLNQIMQADQWSIDLASADKTLTVSADLPTETIVQAVTAAGFKATLVE